MQHNLKVKKLASQAAAVSAEGFGACCSPVGSVFARERMLWTTIKELEGS